MSKVISIRIPTESMTAIDRLTAMTGRDMADLIRELIDRGIDEMNHKPGTRPRIRVFSRQSDRDVVIAALKGRYVILAKDLAPECGEMHVKHVGLVLHDIGWTKYRHARVKHNTNPGGWIWLSPTAQRDTGILKRVLVEEYFRNREQSGIQ